MKKNTTLFVVSAAVGAVMLAACGPKQPESVEENFDTMVENIQDSTDEMVDDVVESTTDQVEEGLDRAMGTTDETQNNTENEEQTSQESGDTTVATNETTNTEDSSQKDDAMEVEPISSVATYGEYAAVAVDGDLAAGKKVVLFFHAGRCPSCRRAHKNITKHISELPGDVAVYKVDYDDSKELRQKYGVTSQHTFVEIDADHNLVARFSGGGVDQIKNLFQ